VREASLWVRESPLISVVNEMLNTFRLEQVHVSVAIPDVRSCALGLIECAGHVIC
jgi:hypothetical protein